MMIRRTACIIFLVLLHTLICAQNILINEVQYKNDTSYQCQDAKYYDWIELFNASNDTIDLSGFYIKDGFDDKDRLMFDEEVLAPGAFLTVFCSDKKGRINEQWHAPFKLAVLEDTVYLFSDNNKPIDRVLPSCVPPDASWSRIPDGASFFVATPTPNASNDEAEVISVNYLPDTLKVNLPSGFYHEPIAISFSNSHPENEIRYTLNGKAVDYDDLLYIEDLVLSDVSLHKNRFANYDKSISDPGRDFPKANILRAQVFSCGCPASDELVNTYFIGDDEFTKGFSVVSIITDPDHLFDDEEGIYIEPNYWGHGKAWEREAHIEIFDSSLNTIIEQNAGIRIHGAGSRTSPQKSLKLLAREEYGDSTFSYPFFNQKPEIHEFPDLLLKCVRDWTGTMFKAEMCQHLVQDLDVDYSASETVLAMINGEYWGIYNLRERLSSSYITNNYKLSEDEFNIVRYPRRNEVNTDSVVSDGISVHDLYVSGITVVNGDLNAYHDLINFLYYSDPKSPSFFEEVADRVDVSAFIDYLISELYLANVDFIDNNVYFWKSKKEGSLWRPIFYDLDGAMANIRLNYLSEYMTDYASVAIKPYWSKLIFSSLLGNPEFCKRFSTRYYELLNSSFSPYVIREKVDEYVDLYKDIMPLHIYRWDNPTDIEKWYESVDVMYHFANQRPVEVFKQLSQPSFLPYKIYPNPISHSLNLYFYSEIEHLEFSIFALSGQKVMQRTYAEVQQIVEPVSLISGVYIMHINVNGFIYTEKLMVKK